MGKQAAVAMLALAVFAALFPPLAWAYVAAFMIFEFWLLRRFKAVAKFAPVPVEAPPYHFSAEEADFVGRFRFYFTYPGIAQDAASTMAALGLSALALAPWLLLAGQLVPGFLVGLNLLVVGALTRRLSPLLVLRIAAGKGDRQALRMLELHDPLWLKINAANRRGL